MEPVFLERIRVDYRVKIKQQSRFVFCSKEMDSSEKRVLFYSWKRKNHTYKVYSDLHFMKCRYVGIVNQNSIKMGHVNRLIIWDLTKDFIER